MNRLIALLDRVLSTLCVIVCAALVVCVVWQVFSRYILNDPSTVTEELARFLFIWVGLVGAAYGLGQKKHLAIDLLLTKWENQPKKRDTLRVIINIISILFIVTVMCYGGGKLVLDTLNAGQISPVLGIQMGLIYGAIPVSGFFMLVFLLRDLAEEYRQLASHN
ncbi:TRAP-type C4-dicarboxylate transport system permease small subunit [Cricetibacter osteomyelitidis]|uniref:TRAP transporter small permease protein n=1 Tax=Cricetibacter osteomyelitidis TaxID=1521931 RepID=A0A4R2T5A2_9PAST|nr:TRAP transporter small permease [Cricetibacter osteomyelitidis]TCP96556.1 TRAP-type C4-dicarboxylate transport system permease small subunit [Cricetibacter osteomyelitidis]